VGRRGEVDLVGADAERPDRQQLGAGGQHLLGQRRVGAQAEHRHPTDTFEQLGLAEGPVEALHGEACVAQREGGVVVDVLQQQGRQRCAGGRGHVDPLHCTGIGMGRRQRRGQPSVRRTEAS